MYKLPVSHKLVSWLYFAVLLVICLMIYRDYGISWDEPTQRNIGTAAYKYVQDGDRYYMQMHDRIYGVGFELPLIYLEKWFGLTDVSQVFFFRHLVQILFFAFGCFVFFRLNLKLFKDIFIALIPSLILVVSPRIFAHGFFNSKDLPFLVMYIISLHSLHNYLLKPGYKNLVIMGIVVGLLINFRIMGILLFMVAAFLIIVSIVQRRKWMDFIHVGLFTLIAGLCLYGTWPYLWEKPFMNFSHAWVGMSKFPWQGQMLFKGNIILPGYDQFDYLLTWIGITIPMLYLIFGAGGILCFLINNVKKPWAILNTPMQMMGWAFLVSVFAPLAAVILLRSILYDDWRQLYFIYPSFIIFIGYLIYYTRQYKAQLARLTFAVCMVYIGFIGIQMIRLHPYEHVYFNEIVPRKKDYIQQHYDEDYWGTSFYDGLKYILKHDQSDTIPVFLFHDALRRNTLLLPEKDRNRIVFPEKDGEMRSKYYLTTFRFDYVDIIGHSWYKEVFYEVKRQNSVILRIWKH